MARFDNLPFERGNTYHGLPSSTLSASQQTEMQDIVGRRYCVEDPLFPGQDVWLRVVQYSNDSDGTTLTAAAKCVDFLGTNGRINRIFCDLSPSVNTVTVPLDYQYAFSWNGSAFVSKTTTLQDGDLVYVVDEGPTCVQAGATTTDNNPCVTETDGEVTIAVAGASPQYVVGVISNESATDAVASALAAADLCVVNVKGWSGFEDEA